MISSHSPPKQNYVTILAIYDEPTPKIPQLATSASKLHIPVDENADRQQQKAPSQFVEIKNLKYNQPSIGLQVQTEHNNNKYAKFQKTQSYGGQKQGVGEAHSVHFADKDPPAVEHSWRQTNARKSRISDTFLEAKERIESEHLENQHWRVAFDPDNYRLQRIILSSDTRDKPMGLEISAVPNPERPSHLLAVEVRTIERMGRLAEDGRLRVGDQIVEINGTSCEQISFARTRLHLRELQSVSEPSLSFFRRIHAKEHLPLLQKAEQVNVLQKGNTSKIGKCREISLIKAQDGFGFTYAGRMNARAEHLYYVKGLRREQGISVGDRILKIDGVDLANLNQAEVTAMLKSKQVGDEVRILISRTEQNGEEAAMKKETPSEGSEEKENMEEGEEPEKMLERELVQKIGGHGQQLHRLEIPLNETPGAGLGISVKAQRKGGTDMGLFVRSILHGSAAYKDGRLLVNDRLVGIESLDLLKYPLNGEALDAFMRTLAQLPPGKGTVRVYVARRAAKDAAESRQAAGSRWGSDSDLSQSRERFVRDSATRRSISEKRPLGLHNDPAHLRTYQRIVHQRQTSAPALTSAARSRRSLHEPSALMSGVVENSQRRKNRPKSTFYVAEDHQVHSRTLPSPKSNNNNGGGGVGDCPVNGHSSQRAAAISASKSQPDSLASFLTRSGTVPVQKEAGGGSGTPTNKRRSSLGSGLLKLFGRSQSSKEEAARPQQSQQQQPRPAPPPYNHNWPPHYFHQQQSLVLQVHPSSSTTTIPHPAFHQSGCSTFCPTSFRLPPPLVGHFPGPGPVEVPHWQHDVDEMRRSPPRHHSPPVPAPRRTIINHSMYGSRPDPRPAAFSVASEHYHHPPPPPHHAHWQQQQHTLPPSSRSPGGGCQERGGGNIGRPQPSAVFYDGGDSGSHWVIRC